MQSMTDSEKYIITRWLYSIGEEPLMSDTEYGNLHRYLVSKGDIPEYTERAWSSDPCPFDLLSKFGLSEYAYEVKLLDKTESMPSITSEREAKNIFLKRTGLNVVSFKLDGWNLQLTYFNGVLVQVNTRGRSSDALVVEYLKKYLPTTITRMGEVKVVGELCLSHDNFARLSKMFPNKEMKSQRSSVRTALANEQANGLLTFLAFDIILPSGQKEISAVYTYYLLKQWGFTTPQYMVARNGEEILAHIRTLSEMKSQYEYISDATVVRSDYGRDVRAARIYGWEEDIYYSYVTGIEEEHSSVSFGCKLLIYSIRTQHSTQQKVNITNIARIQEYDLYVGSPIAFGIRSDAIADPDISSTRYLQEMWKGNYEGYRNWVIINEAAKLEKATAERNKSYDNLREANTYDNNGE